jgi:outer membrane protein TolC
MKMSGYIKTFMVLLIFLSCLFIFPTQVHTDDTGTPPEDSVLRLSMEEGILMVLKRNLDIAVQQIDPQVETAKVEGEEGIFDPEVSGSFTGGDSTTPLSSRSSVAAGGRSIVERETYHVNTALEGKLPVGMEYKLEFDDIWTKDNFNDFESEYDAFAGITVTQPLLKNFGNDVNLFNIHIAQKDRELSLHELKQEIIDTVADFKKAYWNMVFVIEERKVKEESLKLAESLLDLARKRLRAEVVSPLEVTQAEAGMASRKEGVLIAQKAVKERGNVLKRFISDEISSLGNVTIHPTDIPNVGPVTLDFAGSFREGLKNRPDYQMVKTEIEKDEITIQYAENQRFPNIDLEASYGFNGLGDTFGDSIEDLEENREWLIGVVIKFPLGNRTAKSDLRVAQLEAKQSLLSLKRIEQDILVEIDNAITEVETNKKRIEAAMVSRRLAEEALRAEEIKLKQGLSTSHNVLDFQEDLTEARSREIIAVIDYNKSLVELSRAKGTVLDDEGIVFSEFVL